MNPKQFVELASTAAVATDFHDQVVAWNAGFRELAGSTTDRPFTGRRLHELLEIADVYGNRRSSGAVPVWNSLLAGERIRPFEMKVRIDGGRQQLVSTSLVVFAGAKEEDSALVYLIEPVLRRRRSDDAIDRLLRQPDQAAGTSLPVWFGGDDAASHLTRRQIEVLRHLAVGASAKELSRTLGLSAHTVRSHIQNIYDRLGVSSRAEVVAWAYRHRLL